MNNVVSRQEYQRRREIKPKLSACLQILEVCKWENIYCTLKSVQTSKRGAMVSVHNPKKNLQSDHSTSIGEVSSNLCALHGRLRPLCWHAEPQHPNRYDSDQLTAQEMQSLLSGRHYRCIPVALVKSKSQHLFSKALMKPQKQITTLWSSKDSAYELPSWVGVDCRS